MRGVVSLYLPSWPVDRLRRRLGAAAPPPEVPLALVGSDGRRRVVLATNAAGRALGLRPGLPAAQAQALVPGLAVFAAAPAEDAAGLARLAAWAQRRYAPVVAPDLPDGLVLDVTGAAHLHGGEHALLLDLVGRLASVQVEARAAMAPTWGAAHALARWSAVSPLVVDAAELVAALGPLPLAALRLDAPTLAGLRQLGLDTIGDLEAQPRAPLALRFGPTPGRRLDQAFGRLPEPITPVVVPDLLRAERAFAEPISAPETLARAIGLLAEMLAQALEAQGLGARRLDLLFHRVDGRVEAVRVGTAQPVREPRRVARLLTDRLERVDPGLGVERMTLVAPGTEPLGWRPALTALGEAPEADVAALVDTLANRLGAQRLYRLAAVESDTPERSVRRVAPLAAPTAGRWEPGWPRPARLLAQPEPVDTMALLPDHPPVHFTWRGVRRRVARADGPERIYGEWVRSNAELWAVRDYFVMEDEAGQRFWLFRAGDGRDPATGSQRWFLHGLFA
ncbi:Y-family DNA polymerase [Rubellimicrobium roseum]|uniref:DNA-directed DNA polymerase n=1 Tax=Rubellimicrobium roseum TaxID=687525 RepID=A0A5C4N340_9RHOB|nr:DNA polymerase Y family protein [Rubellimicrobium roseum]TNC59214.1 DNA polymerase Y family protein [Rubellimicrobium roseum]